MLIIGILATVALALFGVLYSLLGYNLRLRNGFIERMTEKATNAGMKEEASLKGRRVYIEREELRSVRVNLYEPQSEEKLPVVFIAHGGHFIDHDADDIDDFCFRMSEEWQVNIVSISYTKISAHITSYPQEEIRDVIRYFHYHADEYRYDMKKYLVMGFEAGAYLSLIAELVLIQEALIPYGIIMIDPFLDYVAVSLAQAGRHPSPVALLLTGTQTEKADEYEYELNRADIYARTRRVPQTSLQALMADHTDSETDRLNRENAMQWLKDTVDLFLGR